MAPQGKRAIKVLVVDDIESNIELLKTVMEGVGFRVFTAVNGKEAIEVFEAEHPDIAIVDIMMPEIDGYQLCQILKDMAGRSFFPVILLTALTDSESKIRGLECGADDFISKPFDARELIAKVRSLVRIKSLYDELEHSENIILTLAVALEARDPYTKGHSTRVGDLAYEFGLFMELSSRELELLRKAGMLHDIGKIAISESILQKPGKLTEDEIALIRKHPVIGEEICKPLNSLQSILPAIRHHHERWDGKGFPDGLKGSKIPLFARILSIIDSFDAMLSVRPYRGAIDFYEAIKRMEREMDQGQWDPELLTVFIELIYKTGEKILNRYYALNKNFHLLKGQDNNV